MWCKVALALFVGIQIGIRLPAAKKGAEQFKNTLGAKIINDIAVSVGETMSEKIRESYFNNERGERR